MDNKEVAHSRARCQFAEVEGAAGWSKEPRLYGAYRDDGRQGVGEENTEGHIPCLALKAALVIGLV